MVLAQSNSNVLMGGKVTESLSEYPTEAAVKQKGNITLCSRGGVIALQKGNLKQDCSQAMVAHLCAHECVFFLYTVTNSQTTSGEAVQSALFVVNHSHNNVRDGGCGIVSLK